MIKNIILENCPSLLFKKKIIPNTNRILDDTKIYTTKKQL